MDNSQFKNCFYEQIRNEMHPLVRNLPLQNMTDWIQLATAKTWEKSKRICTISSRWSMCAWSLKYTSLDKRIHKFSDKSSYSKFQCVNRKVFTIHVGILIITVITGFPPRQKSSKLFLRLTTCSGSPSLLHDEGRYHQIIIVDVLFFQQM